MTTIQDIPRPTNGDVVELILADHRLFESLLRELRDAAALDRALAMTSSDAHLALAAYDDHATDAILAAAARGGRAHGRRTIG